MHSAALWLGLSGLVIIAVLMQRKIKVRTPRLLSLHVVVTHADGILPKRVRGRLRRLYPPILPRVDSCTLNCAGTDAAILRHLWPKGPCAWGHCCSLTIPLRCPCRGPS